MMLRTHHTTIRPAPRRAFCAVAIASAVATAVSAAATAQPPVPIPAGSDCPALYVLGIQPAEETSPDAAPTTDTGMLGTLFQPLLAEAGSKVQRVYVPYAGTTSAPVRTDAGSDTYDRTVSAAVDRLSDTASRVVEQCPTTLIAGAGYAQGAQALAEFARRVGAGTSAVPADRVAAIALFANPVRRQDDATLPGAPGRLTPSTPPQVPATAVSAITLPSPPPHGAGMAAALGDDTAGPSGYGALTGRVADLCAPGDLACDTPDHAALLRVVSNIASRADLHDPIAAISTIAAAMAETVYSTAVGTINDDMSGTTLDQLDYAPTKSISQRLAEASDPRTPVPGPAEAFQALFKLGTIAFNTVTAVAQKVLTPATIAELITVGLVDPIAAVTTLGTKLADAVVDLVPPSTGTHLVTEAFDTIRDNITDNADLFDIGMLTKAADTIARRADYGASSTPDQQSLMSVAAHWFAALATASASATTTGTAATSATTTGTAATPVTTTGTATAPATTTGTATAPTTIPAQPLATSAGTRTPAP
jgi:hypothetical protein